MPRIRACIRWCDEEASFISISLSFLIFISILWPAEFDINYSRTRGAISMLTLPYLGKISHVICPACSATPLSYLESTISSHSPRHTPSPPPPRHSTMPFEDRNDRFLFYKIRIDNFRIAQERKKGVFRFSFLRSIMRGRSSALYRWLENYVRHLPTFHVHNPSINSFT